ncbi:MAG: lamin tail domain-containing protein [Krumholzibacteria bacterium]|nr:lamin tail domain-containing protein [Candidatus Krumholzibacteria bacterium]
MTRMCRPDARARALPLIPVLVLAALAAALPAAAQGDGPDKLLLTEICTLGTAQEFVEIWNPNDHDVDMSDYYLTDAVHTPGDQGYWYIGGGVLDATTVGGGTFNDFQARFPAGFTIAAGDTIVVSIAGSNSFAGEFGFLPDLELFEDGGTPDQVPDMRWVFGTEGSNSIVGSTVPTLTNGGEVIILYHYAQGDDLATDIDVFVWKSTDTSSFMFSKTGKTVGTSTYLPDTAVASQRPFTTQLTFGDSYQRVDATESTQTATGSNGVGGRDELSENFATAFAMRAWDPSRPGGGEPPPVPDPDKLLLTEIGALGAGFIEIWNPNDTAVDLGDYYLTDAVDLENEIGYWNIGSGVLNADTIGGGVGGDFHARFPDGFTLAAGDTVVIAVAGSDAFALEFGFLPDLELFEDGAEADDVPDLRWLFGAAGNNSIVSGTSTPDLADDGESVVLYHFAQGDDLATDIDVFFWGTGLDYRFTKTGITVGGSTYLAETAIAAQQPFTDLLAPGESYQRTDETEGTQTASGGNGTGGSDELSENLPATFARGPWDPSRPPADPEPGEGPAKLLLTEICTLGTAQEFVEIWNPNDHDVDMSDYYLTDAIFFTNNTGYWNIGGGVLNADTIGGGAFTDFHARFPAGYTIAAGDTIVVSLAGSNAFAGEFGFLPHLELWEDDPVPDGVPDMRWVFGTEGDNSIIAPGSVPTLTNGGEPVVLYHYAQGDDLVTDIDIFVWKSTTTSSFQFSKTGKTVGTSMYLPETAVGSQQPFATQLEFGNSYQRVDATEGTQATSGSNGVDGRDELSENLTTTFAMLPWDPARPSTGPGPGPGAGAVALKVPALTFLPELGEAFPVQFTGRPASETRVRLFNQAGRLVLTLFDSRFDGQPATVPGSYTTLYWDGRDDTYERVPAGMYILHLSVVETATGDEETRTAPVVVSTRLSK